jgi:hypothetical protein
MKKINYRIVALTVIVIACLFHAVSYAQMRDFIGSNGKVIEAEFLGFDAATQIVKLRLKDGREQNVKLDLFSAACQQWIKAGGKDGGQQGDNPFGNADAPLPEQEGDWEWLFDGRSLNGWEGDTNAWRVDQNDKTLVNTGRGNLFTRKQYDNFVIQLEFRCRDRATNGLLLRVDDNAKGDVSRAMRIQIADDRNYNTGRDHNGSVFGTLHGPKPFHRWGEDWNYMEVIADGQKITTYVNGMKVVDDTLPKDKPFSNVRSGRIGFMGSGGTTEFRYIRIKPLKAGEDWRTSKITTSDSREGFTPIFDGRTLNGWRGEQNKFRAENNVLNAFDAQGKLETIKEYRNFALRFEYRLSRDAIIAVHMRKKNEDVGFNTRLIDESSLQGDNHPHPFHFNGSIDFFYPARRGSSKAFGQWNTMGITANGSMIRVVENDQIVVDTDVRHIPTSDNAWVRTMFSGMQNESGHIEIYNKKGQIEFRNIRIKELP